MIPFFLAVCFVLLLLIVFVRTSRRNWLKPEGEFPQHWKTILLNKIGYYNSLSPENKILFEYKVHEFLLNCKITGIGIEINDTDRLLTASSAIIPIFAFTNWKYHNLSEVLIYPDNFNETFQTGTDQNIMGMVGTGYMEDKMIISQKALYYGFNNQSDKKNTAIHEFVHLIDKADGVVDGIPELLLDKQYVMPWIELIRMKIEKIYEGSSDINPYGASSKTEFFAVVSEYFFENPKLLKEKHPLLYKYLQKIFKQPDILSKFKRSVKQKPRRNDVCLCGSGKKFKHCCGN